LVEENPEIKEKREGFDNKIEQLSEKVDLLVKDKLTQEKRIRIEEDINHVEEMINTAIENGLFELKAKKEPLLINIKNKVFGDKN
jgi:hypothetical protein